MASELTTGVIARDSATKYVHVDILNKSSDPIKVEVNFINWIKMNSSSIIKSFPATIPSNSRRAFTVRVVGTSVNHYEITIDTLIDSKCIKDIIANVYASSDNQWPPFNTIPANCVSHKDLVQR
ncbi:MAG: hypothetical protein K0S34_404 [Bacillales bacterium]|jgi:hypothetical protein|nr:hypothetical protein [Bacillales bacterium]